jgi:hypothetical protein
MRNAELHKLYSFPNIVRMIQRKSIRLARYVGRMGEKSIQNIDGKS